jgi:microcystin-dependent protein
MPAEPFLGEVMAVALPYAPAGWADCNGALLPIGQHSGLFSVLGTRFGGDGRHTFGLPDLRGATVVGSGEGPGLEPQSVGDSGGVAGWTLQVAEMPAHTHRLQAVPDPADQRAPSAARSLARGKNVNLYRADPETIPAPMVAQELWPAGGSKPHDNMPPSLVLRYVIAITGIFPPRD